MKFLTVESVVMAICCAVPGSIVPLAGDIETSVASGSVVSFWSSANANVCGWAFELKMLKTA